MKSIHLCVFQNRHLTPAASWGNKSVNEWVDEIGGIKEALSKFANIPKTGIRVKNIFSDIM